MLVCVNTCCEWSKNNEDIKLVGNEVGINDGVEK